MLNQHQHVSFDNLKIALGDKVKIKLKDHKKNKKHLNIGTVLFYGCVESHEGTYYGISLDSAIGKNNGTYKQRKYFECKHNHGCFVEEDQIIKIISPSKNNESNIRLHCNSIITLPDQGSGKIRFAGLTSFNPGIWYGIELNQTPETYNNNMDSPKTSNANGMVSGIQYFKCTEGNAIFRRKEDLYAILGGVLKQKNIRPSLTFKHNSNPNKDKKRIHPKMKKATSAPYSNVGSPKSVDKLPALMDLSNMSGSDNEIQENNDHSNETKEEDDEDYDYPLKLMPMAPSDEMFGDDEQDDEMVVKRRNIKKHDNKPRKNTGIKIAESDTSDIEDNMVSIKNKSIPHISIDNNNNVSSYVQHVQQQNVSPAPKSYNPPAKSRKSIKRLKNQFKNACNTGHTPQSANDIDDIDHFKINISSDRKTHKKHNKYKGLCGTPVKFGQLSLEYSTSSPTEDIDDDEFPAPSGIRESKSVPPNIYVDSPSLNINASQSARSSPTGDDRNRALTFPTMALNTDNATKVSAATPSQQTFRVVVLGKSRAGKTAIIRKFVKDKFLSHYKMTINAVQWQFKCEVPIDLIEEVIPDQNMVKSMTSFFGSAAMDKINEEDPSSTAHLNLGFSAVSHDPFDEYDKNAEFGAEIDYDYNTMPTEEYKLNKMDNSNQSEPKTIQNSNQLDVGLFDYQSDGHNSNNNSNKSITDYGSFTLPELDTNNPNTDIRKISMKLQITLDIIDMGFHPTKEELFNDVNAIILVIDYSKKGSIQDAIDKYQSFLKHSLYVKSKKRKRKRSRSASNPSKEEIEREYIPLIIAINKMDLQNNQKQFKKREVRKIIYKRLLPIINEHFPESDADDDNNNNKQNTANIDNNIQDYNNEKQFSFDGDFNNKRKPRNFTNATLLQPPNLSFVYDEGDNKGSDSEWDDTDDEDDSDYVISKPNKKTSSDLLNIARVYHKQQISSPDDPFNTPKNKPKKRKKKSSKKVRYKKRDKKDIRYIDIINCSAKEGTNIEHLFGTCIKKTIPSKLTKQVAHKRTKTTAHVTAPIWLRQVVAEFQNENVIDEENKLFGHTPTASMIDDNFKFLGEDDKSD